MMARIVLFDLDGTLVTTGGAGLRAFDRAMEAEFGSVIKLNEISPAGMTDTAIFREIFGFHKKRPPAMEEEEALFKRYLEFLEEEVDRSEGFRVLPGVGALLEELESRDGFLLGLGTGNLEEGARIKLKRAGLDHYFSFGGYGSDSSDRTALLRIAVEKGRTLAGTDSTIDRNGLFIVGDTPRDIEAGRALDARILAVATGPFPRIELERFRPDLAVDTLLDRRMLMEWFLS